MIELEDEAIPESYQEYLEIIYRLMESKDLLDVDVTGGGLEGHASGGEIDGNDRLPGRQTSSKAGDEKWITNQEIAGALNVKPASVTEMLSKLERRGLLVWKRRKGVRLSREGIAMGGKVLELHQLLETFLTEVLEIDDEDLKHRIACSLEHHLIEEPGFVEAIEVAIKKVRGG